MSRPPVTVVMPFAGDDAAARAAVAALHELETRSGDELILVDNSEDGVASQALAGSTAVPAEITVERAGAEHSPAHARNVGAERAHTDWVLFLDADCWPSPTLLDDYLAGGAEADIGALAGEVIGSPESDSLATRYGAARSFLSQEAHLGHPYKPRAVAANLMVRRAAFEQVGGFYEGVRAAEDTDLSWRLQQAGWRLELRSRARVEHTYRATIGDLRRQWRGYAAGRAWLARRYDGFVPEPALRRAVGRGWRRTRRGPSAKAQVADRLGPGAEPSRLEHARHLALDVVLGIEELAGLTLSNRPATRGPAPRAAGVVLVAERFPSIDDPLAEFARTLTGARVEAVGRPAVVAVDVARELRIDYREDDGIASRARAVVRLAARHPIRCLRDRLRGETREPKLSALAPAAMRLQHEPAARLQALGGGEAHRTAQRLAALAGRTFEAGAHS